MYCPICGRRLSVVSESNRWTNGKPRFKYVCPGFRKGECAFKAVDGVELDEYVVQQLSNLSDQQSEYYRRIFEEKLEKLVESDQSEQEYKSTQEAISHLQAEISAQVRNMREADESLRKYIEADIQELSSELEQKQETLRKMEELRNGNQTAIHELSDIKKRLLFFEEMARDAQPEVLVSLISTVVERIYVTTEENKRVCQIFIKGCATEDYFRLFGAAEYIKQNASKSIIGCEQMYDSAGCSIRAKV